MNSSCQATGWPTVIRADHLPAAGTFTSLSCLKREPVTTRVGLATASSIGSLESSFSARSWRCISRSLTSGGSTSSFDRPRGVLRAPVLAARCDLAANRDTPSVFSRDCRIPGDNHRHGVGSGSPEGLTLLGGSGELHQQLTWNLPSLQEPYRPFFGPMANCHVETIFAAVTRSVPAVEYRREYLRMADGGTVTLDWPIGGEALEGTSANGEVPLGTPWLILLPGLTGGSHDSYVRHMLERARRAGWGVVVFNSRGCANSPVTSPQFYTASFTGDLREVVRHVASLHPLSRLYAVGWCVGSNILVYYLGEEGEDAPLSGAVSLCNPFDMLLVDKSFHTGFNRFYDQVMIKKLREIFSCHASLFEGLGEYDIERVARATTVRDFDDGLTTISFGYPSVDAYYYDASSCRSIKNVSLPLLCIQALDDPMSPADGIPYSDIENNPFTMLVVTSHGGHNGWMAGPDAPFGAPWPDVLTMEFLEALEQSAVKGESKGVPHKTAYEK